MGKLDEQIKAASKKAPVQSKPPNTSFVRRTADSMRKRLDLKGKRREIGF